MSTLRLLDHPEEFRMGVRVLLLKGRNKDGADPTKVVTRVTRDPDTFTRELLELDLIAQPYDRIYATLMQRDTRRAALLLKNRMAQIDYQNKNQTTFDKFYNYLPQRWASILSQKECEGLKKEKKLWLLDVDNEQDSKIVDTLIYEHGLTIRYRYRTKNGTHVIVEPFNRSETGMINSDLLNTNAMMLWGYPW